MDRPPRDMTPGVLIRAFRTIRNISQSDLAAKLGVSSAHMSRVESGRVVPSDKLCLEMSRVLGLDEGASRWLRARALEKRARIRIEDLCPHPHALGSESSSAPGASQAERGRGDDQKTA